MDSNSSMGALIQAFLIPSAHYIVIVDRTSPFTMGSSRKWTYGSIKTELPTHHYGIKGWPKVLTDSAPCTIEVNFYTSRDRYLYGTSLQSYITILELCSYEQAEWSLHKATKMGWTCRFSTIFLLTGVLHRIDNLYGNPIPTLPLAELC